MPAATWIDGTTSIRPAWELETIQSVKSEGATGDGVSDDTAAIDAAFAIGGQVYFPPGSYVYNGLGYGGAHPVVIGSGSAFSTIILGTGCSLLKNTSAYASLTLRDLTISGGFGAIRHTYTGINVQSLMRVEWCAFTGYTGTAISSLTSDMPYWHIAHNKFFAADDDTTMGIALAGATDGCIIVHNAFLRDRVHVKFLGGGDLHLDQNDFIQWNPSASNQRASVWFVPGGTPNETMFASGNKFGNENLLSTDYKVLYADEDAATGSDHATRFPDTTNASSGVIARHRWVENNTIGNSAGSVIPFVYSMTPFVYSSVYAGARSTGRAPRPADPRTRASRGRCWGDPRPG